MALAEVRRHEAAKRFSPFRPQVLRKNCVLMARGREIRHLTTFMSDPHHNNSGEYPHSTTPLSAAAVRASQLDPEFCDVRGLDRLFGIKRSLVYQLFADGLIESVSLRRRGRLRGKRLFSVDSVRAYLREQMASQNGEVVRNKSRR